MKVSPIKTRIFQEGESLGTFIRGHLPRLKERSILVVTSKIVALAEKRTAIAKDELAKERLIKKESSWAAPTKHVWLTLKDGMAMANAGIDESNGNGKLILLPKDSFHAAAAIRKQIKKAFDLKKLGVVITDSRCFPLRAGVVGVALGYAGFKGLRDYRGKPDLFKRPFHFSTTNVADSLSTAAVLLMGEGDESQPLAVIEGAPVVFTEKVSRKELSIAIADDIYKPLLASLDN